jgi:cytochrome b561
MIVSDLVASFFAEQPMNNAVNAIDRYGAAAIAFHWAMFLLVIAIGILGLLHDSWPKATQPFWINVHAVCGLALWLLLLARIWWRARHPPPPLPPDAGTFSRATAGPVHFLLYALLFVIPIIGLVTFIWHGRNLDLGLFQVNFGVRKNPAVFHPTEDVHGYLAYGLFTVAGIHALAGLWHHFVRRDAVLKRMWPASM